METVDFITLLIEAILALAILIAFFVLCKNTSRIRQAIIPKPNEFDFLFPLYITIGDKEKAKELLIDKMRRDNNYSVPVGEYYHIDLLVRRYKKQLDMLGITIDQEFLDSIKPQDND